MATSGAMADFGRMPTQKKILVFVVIGLVLAGLYYQFVWKSLNEDLEAAEADRVGKATQNKKLAEDIVKYDELKTRMKELTQVISENQKALPTEAEVPAFFETLERKVTEAGVEIRMWKKLNEAPVEEFVKVPVEIEITGTFMQIKRFFASLVQKGVSTRVGSGEVEERDRIVSIDNLSLTNPVVKNREIHLTAKFVAITFRQEDPAAVPEGKAPKGKGGKAPAAAPAAPAAAPASKAPPLPPAASPAGAKARTDGAINKDNPAAGADEGAARLKGGI